MKREILVSQIVHAFIYSKIVLRFKYKKIRNSSNFLDFVVVVVKSIKWSI